MLIALTMLASAAVPPLTLMANGLGLGDGKALRFGTPEAQAVAALSAALGPPVKRGTYPDCGQGIPIGHVHYRGQLEISFIRHRFVGWTLDKGGPAQWRSAKGIGLGSTLAAARRAQADAEVDDSGESIRLLSETGPSGFLSTKSEKAVLIEVHAGQTCIVD